MVRCAILQGVLVPYTGGPPHRRISVVFSSYPESTTYISLNGLQIHNPGPLWQLPITPSHSGKNSG